MNKIWKSALLSLIGLSLAAPAAYAFDDASTTKQEQTSHLEYSLIAARNAYAFLNREEGLVILDVRSAERYEKSHIPGATHIALNDPNFAKKLERLDETILILIYDDLSPPVRETKEILTEVGFTKAIYLRDGFVAWQRLGYPVEADNLERKFDSSAKPIMGTD